MTSRGAARIAATGLSCAAGGAMVVTDVTFDVPAGARLAVVGPNGTGKSTLLRAIAGIRPPAAGTVRVDGVDIGALRARQRALAVAFVGQEEHPSAELTVAEAVALGRTPHRGPWSVSDGAEESVIAEALAAVGMADYRNRPCTQLSGGERHRVTIARALAQEAPVLVLDEPTNHLDVAWRLRLMRLIDDLDCTTIAAIHDLDLAVRCFDLVAVLDAGTLRAFGPPADTLTPDLIHDVFAVRGDIVTHPTTSQPHLLLTEATPIPALTKETL
ncbi:ABC transporter ATP-binding protein [Gordonia hydrophobica]|uniref:ABC transporter ATP-binding protein n=1 Tax=Gordonia hydrophobica TaxID=40516 RepID=A0ABZ2U621_9ACTN|nr:ABC transporter ATP-binding protein [Gordonia hydrophobica]MBM7368639.1 iron complex transport system ATP-binding protein [Gordonia hydrophobica]